MLKSLKIQNFQSHRITALDFCKGINVIVGKSQAGKTAILRALNWVVNNRPSGFAFKNSSERAKMVKVELELDEGAVIALRKTSTAATYTLQTSDGKIKKYSKFSQNVPAEISETINMRDINFQEQLEGPFLVTSSAGAIAKVINRITNAEAVDAWVSQLTSEINETKKDWNRLDIEIFEIDEDLEKFSDLPQLQKNFSKLQTYHNQINNLSKKWDHIEKVVKSIKILDYEIDKLEKIVSIEKHFNKAIEIEEKIDQQIQIRNTFQNYIYINRAIKKLTKGLTQIKAQKAKFDAQSAQIALLKWDLQNISALIKTANDHKALAATLDFNRSKYIHAMERAKKCPFCFTTIDEKTIKRIGRLL